MNSDPKASSIGFIGLGIMGQSMAGHLLAAGHRLHVYNRSPEKAKTLVERGALWEESPAALAKDADVVFTMVGYPADVEAVYFDSKGLLEAARPGTFLVDMTTSDPTLAVRISEAAAERGLHALDAPVTGGDFGAREAQLSIMVGGQEPDFQAILPLLQLMGNNIVLHGPAGSGQRAKLCNQVVVAGNMLGLCEGLAYARAAGLDPEKVLRSIGSGAAGSVLLSRLGPKVTSGDFAPGFYIHHFIKDMAMAEADARSRHLELPALEVALELYRRLQHDGAGEEGTQALIKAYRERTEPFQG
jgi:3-hydroxyisobutyrate dehydrogenase